MSDNKAFVFLLNIYMAYLPLTAAENHDVHTTDPDNTAKTKPLSSTEKPIIPEGTNLDEVLDRAAAPPPTDWPPAIHDNAIYAYWRAEQFEWRTPDDGSKPHLGWEMSGWLGTDYSRIKLDFEGEWQPTGEKPGESEFELRHSRLFTPFWSLEYGVRYGMEWQKNESDGIFSGVISLSGVAPYLVEINNTFVITEDTDISVEFEAEYDLRITQRLVLQPRIETAIYAQDIPERAIYAGINDIELDLRLRYELKRKFAPYIGLRSEHVIGSARDSGDDNSELVLLTGLRWAW